MAENLLLSFSSEEEAFKMLEREGRRLEKIARKEWQSYLKGYTNKQYIRTGKSEKAIKLGKVHPIGINEFGIELTWVNNLVYHDSWLYQKKKVKKNEKGHSVMLISRGWHSPKLEKLYKKRVQRHTYYDSNHEGYGYIDIVMAKFEATKDPRISIELQWSGAFTK